MASYELTGRLIEKFDEQKVSETFRKREFVVETRENRYDRDFIETIKFQVVQDKCALLDNVNLNDDVKITFNIRGRRYDKDGKTSYFTNLEAWRIEPAIITSTAAAPAAATSTSTPAPASASEPVAEAAPTQTSGAEDDLPF